LHTWEPGSAQQRDVFADDDGTRDARGAERRGDADDRAGVAAMSAVVAVTSTLAAVSAVALPVTYATFVPTSGLAGRVFCHGRRDGAARVAITFDDGPTAPYTQRVLDKLRELDVRATFFVIGKNVERAPELVRRLGREGHVVGNHTYHHRHYGFLRTTGVWREELRRTADVIADVLG